MNPIFMCSPSLSVWSNVQYEPDAGRRSGAARIFDITCCAPAAISRASELTVTNRKPLAMRFSAASGLPLWMPATTPCALARARMWSIACAAFGSRSSNTGVQPSASDRSDGPM